MGDYTSMYVGAKDGGKGDITITGNAVKSVINMIPVFIIFIIACQPSLLNDVLVEPDPKSIVDPKVVLPPEYKKSTWLYLFAVSATIVLYSTFGRYLRSYFEYKFTSDANRETIANFNNVRDPTSGEMATFKLNPGQKISNTLTDGIIPVEIVPSKWGRKAGQLWTKLF